jgi:hypothetical protein
LRLGTVALIVAAMACWITAGTPPHVCTATQCVSDDCTDGNDCNDCNAGDAGDDGNDGNDGNACNDCNDCDDGDDSDDRSMTRGMQRSPPTRRSVLRHDPQQR